MINIANYPQWTFGIDTSYWEGDVDWAGAKAAGVRFGMARALNGFTVDKWYQPSVDELKAIQVPTSDYQYFQLRYDPIQQAHAYWNVSKGLCDFPPCADCEATDNVNLMTTSKAADRTLVYLKELERLFGRRPFIYTGYYNWRDIWGNPKWSAEYDLHIAAYNDVGPYIPDPWKAKGWLFWQFTDRYPLGVVGAFDGNFFNGTLESLYRWMGKPMPEYEPTLEQRVARLEKAVIKLGGVL